MPKKNGDGRIPELEIDGTPVRRLLKINKEALDDEMQTQSDLFFRICTEHTLAMSARDAAWEDIKRIEASLDGEIRAELARSEDKVTETMVKSAVADHPKRQKAYDGYLQLKLMADLWAAAKDSFEQRSKMLRELASLFVSGYWVANAGSVGKRSAVQSTEYEHQRRRIAARRAESRD